MTFSGSTRYGLYFILAFSVLAFGSTEVWAYTTIEFAVFLTFTLFVLHRWLINPPTYARSKTRKSFDTPSNNGNSAGEGTLSETPETRRYPSEVNNVSLWIWLPLGLFALLILFQLLPLPDSLLKHISPTTYRLYQHTLPDWGSPGLTLSDEEILSTCNDSDFSSLSLLEMTKSGLVNASEGQQSYGMVKIDEIATATESRLAMTERAGKVGISGWRSISINRYGTFSMLRKFLAYMGIFFVVLYYTPREKKNSVKTTGSQEPGKYNIFGKRHGSGSRRTTSNTTGRMKPGAVPDFIFGVIWVIFFLGLFNALFSFLQEVSGGAIQWLRPLAPSGIYLGTFKSPNNFSEFLEMVIPLTMGLLLVQNYAEVKRFSRSMRAKIARIAALFSKTGLLSFGIVILIPALFLSLCRGGFVTFPVTMIITFIFMIVSYRLHDRYSFTLFSIVIFGGIAFLLLMGVAPVISELQNLFASGPTSARPQTYIEAIAIIRDFPVFGIGLGNWKDIILKYHTMVGREIWQPAIAYNDTLQLAAETGLAGLACMIAFLFMIYRKAIIALKRGKDIVRQSLILGGVTAMSAALIHCQFDYLFVLPSHAVVFMVIAGLTYRISCESLAKPRGREL